MSENLTSVLLFRNRKKKKKIPRSEIERAVVQS